MKKNYKNINKLKTFWNIFKQNKIGLAGLIILISEIIL